MNFRTTLILLILLVGAATFIYFANRSGEPPAPNTETNNDKGRQLLSIPPTSVTKVVIRPGEGAPAGAKIIELTKKDEGWKITQPIQWPAASMEVSSLVDAIVTVRSNRSVDLASQSAGATGLSKPRYRIEVTDNSGKVEKLTIGDRSPLGHLYVQANDDKDGALVSGGALPERMARPSDELVASLRDKHPLQIASAGVKQVFIERQGEQPTVFLQKQQEQWQMVSPVTEPADTTEVSNLISALTDLEAQGFADSASAARATRPLSRPRAVVTLYTTAPATQPSTSPAAAASEAAAPLAITPAATRPAGGTQITIGAAEIGGDECWLRVEGSPPVIARVVMPSTTLEKFTRATPLSLRDRKVLDLDPEKMTEVTIRGETAGKPGTNVRLVRRNDLEVGPFLPKEPAGPATGPATAPATQPATQPSALSPAAAFLASAMLLEAGAPATQPAAPVAQPETPATQPASPATQPASPESQPSAAPATQPATRPAAQATATTKPAVPEKPPTKWLLASAGNARADDASIADLLDRVCKLRATRYIESSPATAPSGTTYTITVKAGPGAAAKTTITFTDPGENKPVIGHYGDLTFEVERSLVDLLKKDFTEPPPRPTPDPAMMQHPPMNFPPGFNPGGD